MRWGFHTHRLSHQVSSKGSRGALTREKGQWDSSALTPAPHPRASPTLTFSPFAPGGPTTACGERLVSHPASCHLPTPAPPSRWEGQTRLGGWAEELMWKLGVRSKDHLSRGPHGSRLSFRSDRARQTW